MVQPHRGVYPSAAHQTAAVPTACSVGSGPGRPTIYFKGSVLIGDFIFTGHRQGGNNYWSNNIRLNNMLYQHNKWDIMYAVVQT